MLHCPSCRYEYEDGTTQCSDCGEVLLPGPGPAEPDESAGEAEVDGALAVAASPTDEAEAVMLRDLLRANEVPAVVSSIQMPWYDGLASLSMTEGVWGHVLVREEDAQRARHLLENYAQGGAAEGVGPVLEEAPEA